MALRDDADLIVVGAGNAALCAALAARELGATVLMLEAAPQEESGGNSRFTAGAVRVVYDGIDDNEPKKHADRGQDLEIEQRLEGEAAQLTHVANVGQPKNDRTEDDRAEQHAQKRYESIAKRFHPDGRRRRNDAEDDGQHYGDKDLDIELPDNRHALSYPPSDPAAKPRS